MGQGVPGGAVPVDDLVDSDVYRNPANHYLNHDKRPYRDLVEDLLAREPSSLP
jgi:hypothetical protein